VRSIVSINRAPDALFEEGAVSRERRRRVERRIVDDLADAPQRDLQLAVEENLLQAQQVPLRVETVARRRAAAWLQQADAVVVVQRPHAHPRHPRQPAHRVLHRPPSSGKIGANREWCAPIALPHVRHALGL
jgi:hypothetical protein